VNQHQALSEAAKHVGFYAQGTEYIVYSPYKDSNPKGGRTEFKRRSYAAALQHAALRRACVALTLWADAHGLSYDAETWLCCEFKMQDAQTMRKLNARQMLSMGAAYLKGQTCATD